MFPIRCYTCNAVLAQHYPSYQQGINRGEHPRALLDRQDVHRLCCRRMFLGFVDHFKLEYSNTNMTLDQCGTTLLRYVSQERRVSCD